MTTLYFYSIDVSFPLLAEIIPWLRQPMRHQANLMFGRNNYHAFTQANTHEHWQNRQILSPEKSPIGRVRHLASRTTCTKVYSHNTNVQ